MSQLPMFHRIGPAAYKANLDNTVALSGYFHNPHELFPTIHVAGTNGKGSVSHMLAAVFQKQGYKTGLATSPHLKDFRERIRVNGKMIPGSYVADFVTKNKDYFEHLKPSFFELAIALTFKYFAQQKVDIAIIETGLGGRLDSTNIITPLVSVITNIGLDHVNLLGDTPEKIAIEKAGIIKPGVPVVIGRRQDAIHNVFTQTASRKGSPLFVASDNYLLSSGQSHSIEGRLIQRLVYNSDGNQIAVDCDLLGNCQQENVATVLQVVDVINSAGRFSINRPELLQALGNVVSLTGLKGRWQILDRHPLIICDTAHNSDGIALVMKQLLMLPFEQLHVVFGMVDDKDINAVLALLPPSAVYYFCRPIVPRGLDAQVLARAASGYGLKGVVYNSVKEALKQAKVNAGREDVIFVGGSTFVVAEVV